MSNVSQTSRGASVFITGGRGFLGRHVCSLFESECVRILAPSRQELDLTHAADVRAYIRDQKPTHVVHLAAACGGIGANIEQPAHFLHANTLMGLNLLEASRLAGLKKFVLVSTTCAYPEDAPMPLEEGTIWNGLPTAATRAYGLAKRFLHEAIIQYKAQYGLDGAVLVPANLYGPGDHYDARSHVVAAMIKRFVEAEKQRLPSVTNWGTGMATREFLHVRDAARSILLACFGDTDEHPVNIGTGVETSIRELAVEIARAAGFEGEVFWDTTKPNGQPRRCLNIDKARRFGFESSITLKEGIAETIADYKRVHR